MYAIFSELKLNYSIWPKKKEARTTLNKLLELDGGKITPGAFAWLKTLNLEISLMRDFRLWMFIRWIRGYLTNHKQLLVMNNISPSWVSAERALVELISFYTESIKIFFSSLYKLILMK